RVVDMLTRDLPHLVGAIHESVAIAVQGRNWLYWPLMIGLALAFARGAWLAWRFRGAPEFARPLEMGARLPTAEFAWYLIGVGGVAIAAYVLTRGADAFVERYLLLALYVPVGILALFLRMERAAAPRAAVLALMCVWTAVSASDHWRQARRYA